MKLSIERDNCRWGYWCEIFVISLYVHKWDLCLMIFGYGFHFHLRDRWAPKTFFKFVRPPRKDELAKVLEVFSKWLKAEQEQGE